MATPTIQEAIDYARTLARTNSTQALTDSDALQFATEFEREALRQIVKKGKTIKMDETTYDVATGNGVTTLDDGVFLIRTVEVDLTGQGTFQPCFPIDNANPPMYSTLQSLRNMQSPSTPLVDFRGDTFEIFPTPTLDVTDGIRVQQYVYPDAYTATSDEVSYPFSQDVYALGYGIASRYLAPLEADLSVGYAKEALKRVDDIVAMIGQGSMIPTKQTQTNPFRSGWI